MIVQSQVVPPLQDIFTAAFSILGSVMTTPVQRVSFKK